MSDRKLILSAALAAALIITGLSACSVRQQELTFSELISLADKYNGKTVTLEAYYFTGFEITALSESVGPAAFSPWRIVPTGTLIWAKGGVTEDIYNRLYIQTETPSGYAEHVGKLRVTGKFETGGKYGHLDAYQYLLNITSAELLEWSPPPAVANDKGAANTTAPVVNADLDLAEAHQIAEAFVRKSSTFRFDGVPGSIAFSRDDPGMISVFRTWSFTFKFETTHPGHGDRTGQLLAQVITTHYATVLINLENNTVFAAACDGTWNMLKDKELGTYVSGIVIGGGDTTPPGLLDAPRVFVYQVLAKQGVVSIKYSAYPPSPVGDELQGKITLDFNGGSVKVGNKMEAYGMLDRQTNVLVVANQGEYIRTSAVKADALGVVVGIRAAAQMDGANGAAGDIYELLRSDGTFVNVRHITASNAVTSFYGGMVKIGDYLRAVGAYDKNTNTVLVSAADDMLKTYDHNPVISGMVLE